MDQSRETLQDRIKRIQDRNQQELLRDIVDSAWSWRGKDSSVATTDRWITVGGQTVRGATAQEKAPETTGGQTDAQGQTTGAKGDKGDSGPAGPAGKDGKDGKDGINGEDGAPGAPGTTLHAELTDLLGSGPEYTHLNAAQTLALTGGGDTNLHWHSADRARANHTGTQASATISDKGLAGGLATLDAGGRVPMNQLPATIIVTTSVVASQSAMLALTAEQGDVAVRTDLSKTFILKAEPASTLENWQELLSPSDGVQSVAMTATGPISVTGSPITNIGTFALTWSGSSSNLVRADGSVVASSSFQPAGSYQPLDSDLTAIAALTTTAFGRSLLTVADAAAARTAIGAQVAGSYESALGNPGTSGYVLASTTGGVRSWVALPSVPVSSVFGRTGAVVAESGDYSSYYLGLTAQAADSAKLGGQLPSYYATAASLSGYLPLSAGSGKPLTGTLCGTDMVMSTGGTAPSVGMYAWPVVPASRTFIGLTSQDGTGKSDWTTTTGLVLWTDSAELSAKVNVGLFAGGVNVLGATSSLITLGAALSGTGATFSAGVVASSFRATGWAANTSYLVLKSPSTCYAGIVTSGSGNQQTQIFAQVDINGNLQRRSDIAANAADFGGSLSGTSADFSNRVSASLDVNITSRDAYNAGPFVSLRKTVAGVGATNYAAGYGFHNQGANGAFLYCDPGSDTVLLKYITHIGTTRTLWDSGNLTLEDYLARVNSWNYNTGSQLFSATTTISNSSGMLQSSVAHTYTGDFPFFYKAPGFAVTHSRPNGTVSSGSLGMFAEIKLDGSFRGDIAFALNGTWLSALGIERAESPSLISRVNHYFNGFLYIPSLDGMYTIGHGSSTTSGFSIKQGEGAAGHVLSRDQGYVTLGNAVNRTVVTGYDVQINGKTTIGSVVIDGVSNVVKLRSVRYDVTIHSTAIVTMDLGYNELYNTGETLAYFPTATTGDVVIARGRTTGSQSQTNIQASSTIIAKDGTKLANANVPYALSGTKSFIRTSHGAWQEI